MRVAVTLMVVASLTGCRCGDRVVTNHGDPVWLPGQGLIVDSDEALLDFGRVPFGSMRSRSVGVGNRGTGELTLGAVASVSGVFTWPALNSSVQPNSSSQWQFQFSPTDDGNSTGLRDFETAVDVSIGGTAEPRKLHLRVKGEGYAIRCEVPSDLDFGVVRVGAAAQLPLNFSNPSEASVRVEHQPPGDVDGPAFDWEPAVFDLAPHATGVVAEVVFRPTQEHDYSAFVMVRPGPDCPLQRIQLHGRGITDVFSWTPRTFDCGWVPVSERRDVKVEFLNSSDQAVLVTDFVATGSAESSPGTPSVSVPGNGAASVNVSCHPALLGPQSGNVGFKTNLSAPTHGSVHLDMKGGGPRISVTPATLAYGRVPYSGAGSLQTTRQLLIRNIGALPPNAPFDGNLHLPVNGAGVPLVAVIETDGGVLQSDVQVIAGEYEAAVGLRPLIQDFLILDVRLKAPATGPLSFSVGIPSDDIVTPRVIVPATADAVVAPPCGLSVSPSSLQFGQLYPGEAREETVTLTNTGVQPNDLCFLSALDVDAASSAQGFELVGGRVDSFELMARQSRSVVVRAHNLAIGGPKSGQLRFEVSSATQQVRVVPLASFSAASCAAVEPEKVNFGQVPLGCSSTRPVTVYNICAAPLLVKGAMTSSGEFRVLDAGTSTLSTAQSLTIVLAFTPSDAGVRSGSLEIDLSSAPRLVDLLGEGVPLQQTSENFVQPAVSQLDLLFATSDHGADSEDSGTQHFDDARAGMGEVVERLFDGGADLHAGILSDLWDREVGEVNSVPWQMGELVRLPDAGSNFVSSSSINPGNLISRAVLEASLHPSKGSTAIDGACFEAGLRALTPPLGNTVNAGFRRTGVQLAVVCLSYYGDFSTHYRVDSGGLNFPDPYSIPLPTAYYWTRISSAAGGASLVTVNALATLPGLPDCPDFHQEDPGSRFRDMATLSSGVAVDICGPSWTASFDTIRQTILNFNRTFTLRGRPDLSAPMTIQVDGVALTLSSWAYDAAKNTVVLATAPSPLAQVQVTYVPRCDQL